jgi:hypothetical protein
MKRTLLLLGAGVLLAGGPAAAQDTFAEGLQYPQRLVFTALGNLLVSEGGTAEVNTGRVSLITRQGTRRSLLEGLPAAPGQNIPAFGPTGMGLDQRTLYLLIGEGNVMIGPPFVMNPDGPASPIFSSVLKIQFSADVDTIASPFQLTMVDHWTLVDGYDVEARNATGDRATIQLLTSFRSPVRNVLGGTARARPADPYGAWLDAAHDTLYIADASSETLVQVNTVTGRYRAMTRFQPDERSTLNGIQFVDNVPTALCPIGDSFLVSFLSAGPFPPGASSVRLWSPSNGGWSRVSSVVRDLTMTSDLLCLPGGTVNAPRLITVEYTITPPANLTTPAGRIQFVNGAEKRVLARDLLLPTGVAQDPVSGDLFVATLPGKIVRVRFP